METRQIRKLFLDYFKSKGHEIVPSSALVAPEDDPSLLFTTAGMVQFKQVFLGQKELSFQRAASCQKCLRAGGKHNDLENVGFTSRHHTFFEMLGNFSFGDYFKEEAINYAWEFITKYLKLPPARLWVTVYQEDPITEQIWLDKIKVDPARLSRCDANENFWAMGDIGPCGPCSEIYYDHGPSFAGSPPGLGDTGERYVEIYNLVFMQYDRDSAGNLAPLPRACVDTGMGLERVAAVMQGVHTNYDIDVFRQLIQDLGILLNCHDLQHNSLKVIADHLRAISFLIVDQVLPSNEGRGYVLRRIMRRAIRHGYKLGKKEPFLHLAVASLVKIMGQDFAELSFAQAKIIEVVLAEELQFARTLEYGMKLLSHAITTATARNEVISGEIIFKLYDTYGFPVDLTVDIAREHNVAIDLTNFEQLMLEQKNKARSAMKFKNHHALCSSLESTDFVGYSQETCSAQILKIFSTLDNSSLNMLSHDQEGKIVLDLTPFYAESGGQVGDLGILWNDCAKFIVTDTQKIGDTHFHLGKLATGCLKVGDVVTAQIDPTIRAQVRANHSATHLLHAALRSILGEHVKQKGSLVDSEKLRFDFENSQALTKDNILAIELKVNAEIRKNIATTTEVMQVEEAITKGAIGLFTEKYQDQVRVLNLAGGFSVELCGGTHVSRTGDIGCFKIIKEEGIAAGIRRIEAITGEAVVKYNFLNQDYLDKIMQLGKISHKDSIILYINKLLQKNKDLTKNVDDLSKQNVLMQLDALKHEVKVAGEIKILVSVVDFEPKYLKFALDKLKQILPQTIIILGCNYAAQATIIVGLPQTFKGDSSACKDNLKFSAIDLITVMAPLINGTGGGRLDLAEARGTGVTNLAIALEAGYKKIIEHVK